MKFFCWSCEKVFQVGATGDPNEVKRHYGVCPRCSSQNVSLYLGEAEADCGQFVETGEESDE